jgi:hypothetical protein
MDGRGRAARRQVEHGGEFGPLYTTLADGPRSRAYLANEATDNREEAPVRYPLRFAAALFTIAVAACGNDSTTGATCCSGADGSLRVINAFTGPVDVLVDGNVAISGLPAGTIGSAAPASGTHSLVLRPASGAAVTKSITTSTGTVATIAAVRTTSGGVNTAVLDDTGSIVPAGKTKLRVLHLAPSAGVLQVYRTQPDYQTPVQWQFPFTYQENPTSLSAPFYQSDVGTWEVRVWQSPADASGWSTTTTKVVVPLGSGERKTVVILDKPGGGVRIEVL